jgi:serine/threonine protein kinase
VDHRADLFSLGSTLYAMCTGHAPFRADSSLAVLRRVIEDEPRPLREVNADVPAWLAAVVARLHAKDPACRFTSAAEVADLLGRCLAHVQQPDAVPLPPIPGVPPRRRPRRVLRWVAVGSLACAALLGPFKWDVFRQDDPFRDSKDRGRERAVAPTGAEPPWEQPAIDAALQQMARQAASVEAGLRSLSGTPGNPATSETRDIGRQLDALEQELNPARP